MNGVSSRSYQATRDGAMIQPPNVPSDQNSHYPIHIGPLSIDPRKWSPTSLIVVNSGSTARDHLANERNFLAVLKLAMTLATLGATLLIQFHFTNNPISDVERNASYPLGITFFTLSLITVIAAIAKYVKTQRLYQQRRVFVETGIGTQLVATIVGTAIAVVAIVFITIDKAN